MNELHKSSKDINSKVESKAGKRQLLCSSKVNGRFPALHYEFTPSTEHLNKAFDILFEEVMKQIRHDL